MIEYMQQEYLGKEMGVREFMVTRPDLFRRALCDILGDAGPAILHIICEKTYSERGQGSVKRSVCDAAI